MIGSRWQSRPHTTKIGRGIPEMNQKGEPRTGYWIQLRGNGLANFYIDINIFLKS
jgi:Mn-containing catalase